MKFQTAYLMDDIERKYNVQISFDRSTHTHIQTHTHTHTHQHRQTITQQNDTIIQ